MSDEDYESNEDENQSTSHGKKAMRTKQNTIKYESDEEHGEPKANGESNTEISEAKATEETIINGEEIPPEESSTSEENIKQTNGVLEESEETNNSTNNQKELKDFIHNVIVTNASVDMCNAGNEQTHKNDLDVLDEESIPIDCIDAHGLASPARSACVSPASSNGGVYSVSTIISSNLAIIQVIHHFLPG